MVAARLYRNDPRVASAVKITTSTQAIKAVTPITFWVLMYSWIRNGVVSPGVDTTLRTISLIESNRCEVLSTAQIEYTATTSMMPAAIENRNDVFITDHGSNRDNRSRAFRVRRATPTLVFAAGCTSEAPAGAAGTIGVPPVVESFSA